MVFKHLVISGGGTIGLKYWGILQKLNETNIWKIENINSMYATSAGSLVCVFLCLKYDWETINKYIIENSNLLIKNNSNDKINFFNRDILEGKIRLNLEYIDQSSDSIGNIYYNLTTTKRGDMRLLDDMRLLPKFREYLEEKILYHIFSKIIKIIGQD